MSAVEHILGQPRAIDVLQAALKHERVPRAWIFHGPEGVGKFTAALAFAKVLLCRERQTSLMGRVTACGSCASCRLLQAIGGEGPSLATRRDEQTSDKGDDQGAGAAAPMSLPHPDLHVVTKELALYSDERTVRERKLMSIPVQVLREALLEPVYRASQLGHNKVFIVDEAQLLNPTGQNLLLKTLEEPPAGTFIILVTAREDELLPTIRSRCQRVAFVALARKVIGEWVDAWEQAQGTTTEAAQRDWLLDFADGSLGRAALALRFGLVHWARTVTAFLQQMTQGRYPLALGGQMAELIDEFANAWVARHANASKDAANRQAAALMWSLIAQYLRRRLRETAEACADAGVFAQDEALAPWLQATDAIPVAERELASNVNLGVVCEHLSSMLFRALGGGVVSR